MKQFHIGDLLSVTSKKVIGDKKMEGVREIYYHIFQDSFINDSGLVALHARASEHILKFVPAIRNETCEDFTNKNFSSKIGEYEQKYGMFHSIPSL